MEELELLELVSRSFLPHFSTLRDADPFDASFPRSSSSWTRECSLDTSSSALAELKSFLSFRQPTIIKPWFGDQVSILDCTRPGKSNIVLELTLPFFFSSPSQYFWGNRVAALGCGIKLNDLHSSELAAALTKATTDRVMREAAAKIGEKIRSESGVDNAIAFFYSYLGRAG